MRIFRTKNNYMKSSQEWMEFKNIREGRLEEKTGGSPSGGLQASPVRTTEKTAPPQYINNCS